MQTNADLVPEGECSEDGWPIGKKAAFYSATIVIILAILDGLDRQIIAALLPYIKVEFELSDTQLGLLVSIVNFAIAGFVIPTAYLVDNWSRKKTLSLMCGIWSLATAACALAGSFTHLFIGRLFVGAGEAGYNPAAQALLSAQFPKKYRSTAISVIQLGMTLGSPIGLLIGSWIAVHYGWRHALGFVAIPGFFFAIAALFIKDFKTKTNKVQIDNKIVKEPYLHTLAGFMKVPSLICIFAGATFFLMFSGVTMGWLPSYLIRHANMEPQVASGLAALMFFPSVLGFTVAGPIIDWFRKRFINGTAIAMCGGVAIFTTGNIFAFAFCTPGSTLQISVLLFSACFGVLGSVGGPTMCMDLVPSNHRASAAGVLVACQNVFGLGIGPLLAGVLSDMFALDTAFLIMTSSTVIATTCYFICIFTSKKDAARVGCEEVDFS